MSQFIAVTKPGCPACEEAKPEIVKAKSTIKKKVTFAHIDADVHPSALEKYEVQAFPDFVYKNAQGKVHHMPWNGMPTVTSIVEWLENVRKGKKVTNTDTNAAAPCAQCGNGHGVSPTVWGPPLWFVIHMVALMYSRKPTAAERLKTVKFFRGLADVLPCDYCKKHYAKELSTMDLAAFDSRDTLFSWTVKFHDSVSDRTHSDQPRHPEHYWRNHYKQIAYNAKTTKMSQ